MEHSKRGATPAAVTRRRYRSVVTRRGYVNLLWKMAIIAAGLWVMLSQVFLVTQAKGQMMYPAIEDGDLLLVYRLRSTYSKGDVVLYQVAGEQYLGRVAARESDVVMLDEFGTITVNGTVQDGGILFPTYPREGEQYPCVIQEGTLYVLGDYRTQAQDSRDFGTIPLDHIQGKVITLLRRRGV